MTLNKAQKNSLEHNHKVVFVYASHRHILRPFTFHLLYHRALHDAILRSFLETAYESIRCEVNAAADSPELQPSGAPVLPASFEGLTETTAAPLFGFFVLSLTTLAQIGMVLAARQDFKDAMKGGFPAVWDPESFLTMRILQTTDASSTLEACIEKRRIGVALSPGIACCGDPSSIIEVDLADLFRMPDLGRSQAHSDGAFVQLAHDINLSRVYIPNVSVLLIGGNANDACISAVTRHLTSQAMPHEHVKLLNLLSPKDSQRFGNEPVHLSKVQGNPCEQIAIVGMSCRVPGASDADDLWKLLKEGKDTLQEIPERLYRYQDYHSASYRDRNVMRVRTANCLSNPSLFDKSLLEGVGSVDDCAKLDPQQRVAILTTHEALQRAGYGFSPRHPPKHPQQWSSHLAYCSDDYREHLSRDIDGSFVSDTHRAHLVARVNEVFGFRGEACSYDTACSSALVAVEAACSSLLAGETSAAVTGGVNIITQPQITIGLDRGFFLSPSSQCMTLDDAGSGYSRADAVSIMLLKRLTDAVRDNDPILAVISSAATNHSGESFSITHPHGETQCRLYQSGMLASGTLPRDYSYIEMHGTGTQSGDLEEVTGIVRDVRGEEEARRVSTSA
ncbi:hypothetical protein L1887_45990 [Cichorium endivia]|nr:hypothetical protein L1887_45990 [Cichorium endivia]